MGRAAHQQDEPEQSLLIRMGRRYRQSSKTTDHSRLCDRAQVMLDDLCS